MRSQASSKPSIVNRTVLLRKFPISNNPSKLLPICFASVAQIRKQNDHAMAPNVPRG